MKVSLNWLTDYLEVTTSAKELGELCTRLGLTAESVTETDADVVFDLEVTSNRPDWLGHLGVARELAAASGKAFRPPTIPAPATAGHAADLTSVQVLDPDLCPRYTARVLRNVTVGPSPAWLVERLQAVGMRSVNNVVDVTNYVLMEYSQPLHCFDYDKLAEHRIVVRLAKAGEQIVSIDGTRCSLTSDMLVIADAQRPVAVAGVMGGLDTEVNDKTTNILLEAAQFASLSVRRTSRALGLMSESNYRFERGVDPVAVDEASRRACQLILQLAGGQLADGVVDVWAKPWTTSTVSLRPARCNALLGMTVPAARQLEILAALGLSPRTEGDTIVCTIPPFRRDLTREADLIEEVARLHGYDKIPIAPHVAHKVAGETGPRRVRKLLARVLTAAGFDEAITFTFNDKEEAALFGVAAPLCTDPLVRKSNNALRPTIVGSLLRACKANRDAGTAAVDLYELAAVFRPGEGGALLEEHTELALVSTGDLPRLRGTVEALFQRIAPQATLDFAAADAPGFECGAAASIRLNAHPVGTIGRVSAQARDYYDLERAPVAAAIRFEPLLAAATLTRTYSPVPKFPAIRRDLSLILDEAATWEQLAQAVAALDQPLRTGLEYVTTFRGKPIPQGRKSLTIALTYRSDEGTLRGETVDEQIAQLVASLQKSLGAEIRS
ncbi:MAG: phenylalanine--tRNA ligase subunit beta [Planctomycetota bacterium]